MTTSTDVSDLCPFCAACGVTEEQSVKLNGDAQALADVRTLDDWADRGEERYYCQAGGEVQMFEQPDTAPEVFEGATPDEARAKAAAWVRSQK